MDAITVRFQEMNRYDPMTDREVVCLMGITGKGSFWAEIEDIPCEVRAKKSLFRKWVTEALEDGLEPCEVSFG